jgi:hypothetical protein
MDGVLIRDSTFGSLLTTKTAGESIDIRVLRPREDVGWDLLDFPAIPLLEPPPPSQSLEVGALEEDIEIISQEKRLVGSSAPFAIDNCDGRGRVTHTKSVSHTVTSSFTWRLSADAEASFPFYAALASLKIHGYLEGVRSEVLSFEDSIAVEAAPYSKALYRLNWYELVATGTWSPVIDGASYPVAFDFGRELALEVEALPPEGCG